MSAPQSGPSEDANTRANRDDSEKPRTETAEQRQQRSRTSRSGLDDHRTEGNVVQVRCDAPIPTVVIANRDGDVDVQLLREAAKSCGSIGVGDYLEARGEKVHEQLFEADDVTASRIGRGPSAWLRPTVGRSPLPTATPCCALAVPGSADGPDGT